MNQVSSKQQLSQNTS